MRSSKVIALPLTLSLLAGGILARPIDTLANDLDDVRHIAEEARQLRERAQQGGDLQPWLKAPAPPADVRPEVRDADRITRQAMERMTGRRLGGAGEGDRPAGTVAENGRTVVVAVSWSLGEGALRDLIASAPDGTRFVVQGILDGERLTDAFMRLRRVAGDQDPPPTILIDPTVFTDYQITVVPEVLVFDDGRLVGRARGVAHPDAVLSRLAHGERGDFGAVGPTSTISERNLIEVMQQRAARLDLEGAKARALEGYWKRAPLVELETASVDRVRRIDATVTVTRDITAPDGRLIVQAGQRLNPFAVMPFRYRLIVVDGRDARQVRMAGRLASETPDGKRPMILLSSIDREAGWTGIRQIEAVTGHGVFVLTPEIRERLKLERVPAVVEGGGSVFTVHEIPPRDEP